MSNSSHTSTFPLQRFLAARPKPRAGENCELCAAQVPEPHSHLVHLEKRALLCVCRACYLLFTPKGAAGGSYKAVPERYSQLSDSMVDESQWNELQIPVGIAFFFFNTALGRMSAFYPSPAGATESLLPLETWGEWVRRSSALASVAADVEALLVHNLKGTGRFEAFIVPIDACYELVGRMRRSWKGFNGGEEAWRDIDEFFAALRRRSDKITATEGTLV